MGPSGWLGLDLTVANINWDEVKELIDGWYRMVAPRSLIEQLDEI